MLSDLRLAAPWWLVLLPLAAAPIVAEIRRPRLLWPAVADLVSLPKGRAGWPRGIPLLLRVAAVAWVLLALARPQSVAGRGVVPGRGVTVVLALDVSSSMNSADFPGANGPMTRLEAARQTFRQFVTRRPGDLLGLVVFANYPDTACPPTLDHGFLDEVALQVRTAPPQDDGTNLGDAIAWATQEARSTSSQRKVVILLTDGYQQPAVPNPLDPVEAAHLASELGVRVSVVSVLDRTAQGDTADAMHLLKQVAGAGDGKLYSADNAASLEAAFETIDQLERSEVRSTELARYQDWFPWCLGGAIGTLAIERLLSLGFLRRYP